MVEYLFIGIDPGMEGAVAAITPGEKHQSWHTPLIVERRKLKTLTPKGNPRVKVDREYNFPAMLEILRSLKSMAEKNSWQLVAAVEAQNSRPNDAKSVATAVGRNQGIWEALVASLDVKPWIIYPHVWKPFYLPAGAPKSYSLDLGRMLFVSHLPLKKDEARAEALLIADYLRRKVYGWEAWKGPLAQLSEEDTAKARKKANNNRNRKRTSKALP